jgi:hypothetical protein
MLTGGGTKADNLAPMLFGCHRITTSAKVCGVFTGKAALRLGEADKGVCEAHGVASNAALAVAIM